MEPRRTCAVELAKVAASSIRFMRNTLTPAVCRCSARAKVSDAGLFEAAYLIDQMLANRDDIRQAMIKQRFALS